jgi:hypothetical protein
MRVAASNTVHACRFCGQRSSLIFLPPRPACDHTTHQFPYSWRIDKNTHSIKTDTHRLRFLVVLDTPGQPGCSVERFCRFAVLARRL